MNQRVKQIVVFSALLVVGTYFLVLGAYEAKTFLVPIVIAILLSMVMLPVAQKFESWGISRGYSVLFSDLLILTFCVGLFFIVGTQVNNVSENWSKYEKKLKPKIERLQQYVEKKTGIPPEKQIERLEKSLQSSGGQSANSVGKVFLQLFTTLGNFLLVFVYIFFFMYYRQKFKNSALKFFPADKRDEVSDVLAEFGKVSQQYLFGRFLLIIFLIVIYSIGLGISGIKNAILISVLAAVLSLIPYVGNIIGVVLALAFGLLTKGGTGVIAGVVITFSIAQFIESYILEPYVVGNRVDLNPVFTILAVVAGGAVWGIAGMIIAIPIMGIFKAIFDAIAVLNPLGYLLGEEGINKGESWTDKIKKQVMRKK